MNIFLQVLELHHSMFKMYLWSEMGGQIAAQVGLGYLKLGKNISCVVITS
jgi:hypothetical protein